MKRIAVLLLFLLLLLCSCSFSGKGEYEVTFALGDETVSASYECGTAPVMPEVADRAHYTLVGWAFDAAGLRPYAAGVPLYSDTTLYPVWSYDSSEVINDIYTGEIEMCVTVDARGYNVVFGIVTDSDSTQGSGVVCHEEMGYYYILTNSHVTDVTEGYKYAEYVVTDCYGNTTAAELIGSDSSTDLALLRIKKGIKHLYVAPVADTDPEVGDTVIALGAPDGVRNAVTFGKVLRLAPVAGEGSEQGTEVDFPVIWHDAAMAHGSSGGALLNERLELVGVNFAIATDGRDGEYLYGFTIPRSAVSAFLERCIPG